MVQMLKNLIPVQEIWAQFLGGEDPLEKGMATYSSILAWRISGTGEPGGLQSMGHKELDTAEQLTLSPKGPPEEEHQGAPGSTREVLHREHQEGVSTIL